MKRKSVLNYTLLVAGIVVLLNIISSRFFFRLDFTDDHRYTLSDATKNILSSLKDPVTVKAYFSENLPPDVARVRKEFKEILVEYANRSHGKVVYEFANPNKDDESEQKAQQEGIQPVMINVREKDQMKQQRAYLGAVVQMGEKRDVIPFMQAGSAMEYALSTSIKKISVETKNVVGLLEGHGEAKLAGMQQAYASLSVLHEVRSVTVSDSASVPTDIKTLAIIDPKDTIPSSHLSQIEKFVSNGGNIFIAYSKTNPDLQRSYGDVRYTGLEDWLSKKGIVISGDYVIDANCGTVNVRQQQGGFAFNNTIQFPYFPLINTFEKHPITQGLEAAMFVFASPIFFHGDSSMSFTPIVKSSKKSGILKSPLQFDVGKRWSERDFTMNGVTLGATLKQKNNNGTQSKIVVFSNGNFAVNGEGQQAQQLQPDNVNLLVNSIDWLSDETGLIELRTRGVSSRPLDLIEDSSKTMWKYFNFLFPVLLIVTYGFVRSQSKRNLRVRRMEEDFS